MPVSLGDVLQSVDALRDLDKQADTRMTRQVSPHEFAIHRILQRLRVASDFERDGVIRGRRRS